MLRASRCCLGNGNAPASVEFYETALGGVLECLATLARPSSVHRPHSNDRRLRCFAGPPWQLSVGGAAAAESAALINTAFSSDAPPPPLLPLHPHRSPTRDAARNPKYGHGPPRRTTSRNRVAPRVRGPRAAGQARPPPRCGALGAVRDGDRVASLLRWCDARGAAYSPSAAVAALALAGHATAARARAAASNVDAVAAALTADGVSPHLAALHAAQRTGALDPRPRPGRATRAVALVLDHRDLLTDDVLVITGRGKHSQGGSAVKREVHEPLTRRGAVFVEENEGRSGYNAGRWRSGSTRGGAARTWRRAASSPCSWLTRRSRPRRRRDLDRQRRRRRRRRRPLRRPYRRRPPAPRRVRRRRS